MSLFCFCTSLAVFFDYILTFTLLAPVLVILASLKGERGVPPRFPTLLIPDSHNKLTTTKSVAEDSTVEEKLHPWIYSYSKFLHSTVGRISAILVASVLIVVASFGVATMRQVPKYVLGLTENPPTLSDLHLNHRRHFLQTPLWPTQFSR
jgi:hypothetical protein